MGSLMRISPFRSSATHPRSRGSFARKARTVSMSSVGIAFDDVSMRRTETTPFAVSAISSPAGSAASAPGPTVIATK
jgi:hypothetical protein